MSAQKHSGEIGSRVGDKGEQHRQQQERQEEASANGQEFLQKLRLGLFGDDEL